MASTTPNLRLVLEDSLTDTGRSNLLKIDSLGSIFYTTVTQDSILRSRRDIYLVPNDPSIGGSGSGGSIFFGSEEQPLDSIRFYVDQVEFLSQGLIDQAGETALVLKYDSTASDTGAPTQSHSLTLDTENGDRTLILGNDLFITEAPERLTLGKQEPTSTDPTLLPPGKVLSEENAAFVQNKVQNKLSLGTDENTSVFNLLPAPTGGMTVDVLSPATDPIPGDTLVVDASNQLTWTPAYLGRYVETLEPINFPGWTAGNLATVDITHNLNSEEPSVDVWSIETGANPEKLLLERILIIDENTVRLEASRPPLVGEDWKVVIRA